MTENKAYYPLLKDVLTRWDYDFAISTFPKLEQLVEGDSIAQLELYAQTIPLFASMGKRDLALQQLAEARAVASASDELRSWLRYVELQWFIATDQYCEAIQAYKQIECGDTVSSLVKLYASVSVLAAYRVLVEYEKLIALGLRLVQEQPPSVWLWKIHNFLGIAFYEIQMFDSAEYHVMESVRIAKELGGHWYGEALETKGTYYAYRMRTHSEMRDNADIAINTLEESVSIFRTTMDRSMHSYALCNLTAAQIFTGNSPERCVKTATEALRLARLSGHNRMIAIAEVTAGDVAWRNGNYKKAGEHFRKALPLIDYPFHYSGLLEASMIAVCAIDGDARSATHYREELERSLYSWSKQRLEGVEAYARWLKERERTQFERELATSALHLAAQTELLSTFRDELRKVIREFDEPIEALKKIKEKLKTLPCESIDWAKFESEFLSVHPEFVAKIRERFPSLTKQEVKLCQLARLGLKNFEMSRLLCLSERTIEGHRFNLRKKLGIKSEESLTKFLEKV